MKPRNYIMANVAKNDPTRYHTRSVDAEHTKLQKNRARRRAQERKEIQAADKDEFGSAVLPTPKFLTEEDKKIILEQARLWNKEFSKKIKSIEIYNYFGI